MNDSTDLIDKNLGETGARRSSRLDLDEVDERVFLKSVERTFRVLEVFSLSQLPLTLTEIARGAGIDKSGAQRICYTLQALGYLERDPGQRGFVPGKRLLERSCDYLRFNPLIERAMPILVDLRKSSQERVDLSLFDDLTIIYAYRLQSKREIFLASLAGRRMPTYLSCGGRAMMAHLPDEEVTDILQRSERLPRTTKTLTDIDELRVAIREARERGYALSLEQAFLGEIVIAAPVLNNERRPIAAIHISGSLAEWSAESFSQRMGPFVIEAARALSVNQS